MQDILFHTLPSFLIVLGVVVFVHEWGHYIVAKMCGVKVESFSLGFGPEIFGFKDKSGTRWKISLLPLGGYVKMFGDEDPSSARPDDKVFKLTEAEKKVAFFHKPVGQRAAIVAAGPGINFLFTFVVFVLLFIIEGQPFTPPRVAGIAPDSPAAAAGLKEGDVILRINDVKIARFEEIRREISAAREESVKLLIDRGGVEIEKSITPVVNEVTTALAASTRSARSVSVPNRGR